MYINIFKIYAVCVYLYIDIINIDITHTYITQTKMFILDAINRD